MLLGGGDHSILLAILLGNSDMDRHVEKTTPLIQYCVMDLATRPNAGRSKPSHELRASR